MNWPTRHHILMEPALHSTVPPWSHAQTQGLPLPLEPSRCIPTPLPHVAVCSSICVHCRPLVRPYLTSLFKITHTGPVPFHAVFSSLASTSNVLYTLCYIPGTLTFNLCISYRRRGYYFHCNPQNTDAQRDQVTSQGHTTCKSVNQDPYPGL